MFDGVFIDNVIDLIVIFMFDLNIISNNICDGLYIEDWNGVSFMLSENVIDGNNWDGVLLSCYGGMDVDIMIVDYSS